MTSSAFWRSRSISGSATDTTSNVTAARYFVYNSLGTQVGTGGPLTVGTPGRTASFTGTINGLVAGDVIWEDGFRQETLKVMRQQSVTGVRVPTSHFLQDSGVDSQTFWTPVVERLNGNGTSGGTSGGLIGTELVGVTALPGNKALA